MDIQPQIVKGLTRRIIVGNVGKRVIAETILKLSEIEQAEIKRDIANFVHTKYITIMREKEVPRNTSQFIFQQQQPYGEIITELGKIRFTFTQY